MSAGRDLTLAGGGGVLSSRPEVAVEAGCRREKRGGDLMLRLPSLGLVIVSELPGGG